MGETPYCPRATAVLALKDMGKIEENMTFAKKQGKLRDSSDLQQLIRTIEGSGDPFGGEMTLPTMLAQVSRQSECSDLLAELSAEWRRVKKKVLF